MAVQEEMSLSELSSIMNLQRQEAFDDNTEALHNGLSKRGSLVRRGSGSTRHDSTIGGEEKKAEEMLLNIIMNQTSSSKPENKSRRERSRSVSQRHRRSFEATVPSSGRDRSRSISKRERKSCEATVPSSRRDRSASANRRQRRSSMAGDAERSKRRSSSNPRGGTTSRSDPAVLSLHSSLGNMNESTPPRPSAHRRRGSKAQSGDSRRDEFRKSQSVGNINTQSSETGQTRERRRSSARSKSPSRDSGSVASGSVTSSDRRGRRPSVLRPSGASSLNESGLIEQAAKATESVENVQSPSRLKSRRESLRDNNRRSSSRRVVGGVGPTRSQSVDETLMEELAGSRTFEHLWKEDGSMTTPPGTPSRPSNRVPRPPTSGESLGGTFHRKLKGLADLDGRKGSEDGDLRSLGTALTKDTISSGTESGKPKKTKLEKIHELQAKCDRYKTEWIETSKDKKKLRKQVQDGKSEIMALSKDISAQTAETAILQKKLSENLQNLDELQDEQRKERNDFSTTAKELAESRIEFTRALNDTRELRIELDNMEEALRVKDRQIADLEDDLKESKVRAEDLDSDLNFAEETVLKLEKEMRRIEEELVQYRAAADKDPNDNGESMRKVREDMEKRLFEDREERLQEKKQKLEDKIRQFEEERERFAEKEKEREEEIREQIRQEAEKGKAREEQRTRLDDDIQGRLQALEEDNKALQGRLKSEQLDSNVKLRQKDERIESLQKELTTVQGQLVELGSDPDGAASLKKEVDAAKSETSTLKDELQEVQKHNSMLSEEIEELQSGAKELQTRMTALQKLVATHKKDADMWQRKSSEWEAKSGEWTDKAHLWKEKSDQWEKIAKEADPDSSEEPEAADPQALFLQAAVQRRQALESTKGQGSKWSVIGNFLGARTTSEVTEDVEAQEHVQELELENAKQAEIIKHLRSEMMKMQGTFKEQVYTQEQNMQELIKERDTMASKNANLVKELQLARKLESLAAQDIM
jgi:chromosome segregation ATPase